MKAKKLLVVMAIFVLVLTSACGSDILAPVMEAPSETPTEVIEEPTAAPVEAPTETIVEEATEATAETPIEATIEAPVEEEVAAVPTEALVQPEANISDFPLPDDAVNVMIVGEGVTTFQTALSIPDVMTFYRFGFPDLSEREGLTEFAETSFMLVFDGHESGKAVIVQGFPISEGTVSVSIRLGDV